MFPEIRAILSMQRRFKETSSLRCPIFTSAERSPLVPLSIGLFFVETFSCETPDCETDHLSDGIHDDILGVVRSGEPTLILRWTPGLASGVRPGSGPPSLCFSVPFRVETYAGGRSATHRQRQGRFFGKPPRSQRRLNPIETSKNQTLEAGHPWWPLDPAWSLAWPPESGAEGIHPDPEGPARR